MICYILKKSHFKKNMEVRNNDSYVKNFKNLTWYHVQVLSPLFNENTKLKTNIKFKFLQITTFNQVYQNAYYA